MREENLDDYDYELPMDRIAQQPPCERTESRLLVYDRGSGVSRGTCFSALPELLEPGDLLVINDTRVIPARIRAHKPSGGKAEILLLHQLEDGWEAMVRPSSRIRPGTSVTTDRGAAEITVHEVLAGGHRRVVLPAGAELADLGEPPLPPYIHRDEGVADADWQRYQTVYAAHDGAVAAPTAGLHFTPELFTRLERAGIETATVTLHVGAGTFEPVREQQLARRVLHREEYCVPPEAHRAIVEALASGRRIVAVGTTVVRTLEAWAGEGKPDDGAWRTTRLFIQPGWEFAVVGAMVTNFHLPRSSLLMLVGAWIGRERMLTLYKEAMEAGYRFYSYGDAMLLL